MSGMNRRHLLQLIGLTIVGVACAPSAPAAPTSAPAPPAAPTAAAPTPAAAKPTAAAAPTTAPATKPAGGATITLKVAHVTTAQKVWDDAWAGIWGSFESKNPGIKLEIENNPFNGYQEKMLTSLAGGSDFDIIYGWEPWLTTFAEKNVIQPLDDYLGKDKDIKLDDFYPAAVEKWAEQLLLRWGVLFRDLLAREAGAPPASSQWNERTRPQHALTRPRGDELRFVPLAEDLFTNSDKMLLRVLHDANGIVTGFTLTVNRVRDLEFARTTVP